MEPKLMLQGGRIAQWIAFLLLAQRPRDRFAAFPKKFNVAEIHGQRTPKGVGSAKSLIVDLTHLVLVTS